MKILVISRNAWDDKNSIGNTMSNFLNSIGDAEFANIYFRSSRPSNNVCQRYYRTTEIDVLKNWLTPHKIGKSFVLSDFEEKETNTAKNEKKLIKFIRNRSLRLAYKFSDYLWYSKKWINSKLEKFVKDFSPDIIVTFVKSAPQYYLTVKYLREKFNIPLFTWIADDEYTGFKNRKANREIENLKYILSESACVTGCSQEICDYYNSVFNCNATPLYKGCDISIPLKKRKDDQITIVYAGNLLYGRKEIICRVVNSLENLLPQGKKISFEVYSNTELSETEKRECFAGKKVTKYQENKEYNFIKQRLSAADIVLHVESFEQEQISKTRYSFSTKIIDYLQSGSVLLAVGPSEISSIKYISKIPGACVIDNLLDFDAKLHSLFDDSSNFELRAADIRYFAQKYHNNTLVAQKIEEIFNAIIKKGE